ncbi:hypothetical protein X275_11090 [Marinitoga sp. 1197]|nr:hypothetical protein X275_11090 [Marinitoga sp. 1197]
MRKILMYLNFLKYKIKLIGKVKFYGSSILKYMS